MNKNFYILRVRGIILVNKIVIRKINIDVWLKRKCFKVRVLLWFILFKGLIW